MKTAKRETTVTTVTKTFELEEHDLEEIIIAGLKAQGRIDGDDCSLKLHTNSYGTITDITVREVHETN